jgi:fluoroacetyl-CoA thioesterase
MKKGIFSVGDSKSIIHLVREEDAAIFNGVQVHPVYGTFALGRDAEWACRQFVLEMKEADEEGIGTFLNVKHHSPALIGDTVKFTAIVEELFEDGINCSFEATVGDRIIAKGTQGQKVLKKALLNTLFSNIGKK